MTTTLLRCQECGQTLSACWCDDVDIIAERARFAQAQEDDDGVDECEGHPAIDSGPDENDPIGSTVYCDGTCRPPRPTSHGGSGPKRQVTG